MGTTTAGDGDLREFANYLSRLGVADCDVVVLDDSPELVFEQNGRALRWVARHVAVRPAYRTMTGDVDLLRAAADVAVCEKVIVATPDVRYSEVQLAQLCELLDVHEVALPQDYLDPMPWWGGIDAGRMLVHRAIEPQPDQAATYGFRRSAVRGLRGMESGTAEDAVRRLVARGAEVAPAYDVFVRRQPPALHEWVAQRPRCADADFALPMKTALFLALGPVLMVIGILGGLRLAGGYASIIAFASVALAIRGRAGAATVFPLRACLFAPLWVAERSISVYWALMRRLRGATTDPTHTPATERSAGAQVASGE